MQPSKMTDRNGQERYLIRASMKGILPEKIRTNVKVRGLQGADWVKRLEGNFDNLKSEENTITIVI